MPARTLPLLILLPLAGCGAPADGGAAADHGRALAALRAGDPAAAEAAADGIAAGGHPDHRALGEFLRGNAAWLRCDAAESETLRDPAAFDRAIAFAGAARDSWRNAAASRPDWPGARRNVERALLRIRRLEGDRDLADRAKGRPPRAPRPLPAPPPPAADGARPADLPAPGAAPPLSREEALALLRRLEEMERVKVAGRRALREQRRGDAERDW